MKSIVGKFYMHRSCPGTFLEVVHTVADWGYVRFWSMGYEGRPFLLDPATYPVHAEVLEPGAWIELTAEDLYEPRFVYGLPMKHRGFA